MPVAAIDTEWSTACERDLASLRLEGELLAMMLWLRGIHPDQLAGVARKD